MGKKRKAVTAVRGFFLEEERKNGALIIDELKDITLGELAEGYVDNSENIEGGVYGWNGNLEIRPKFQRSFVVDGNVEWQSALIHSVLNKRPIGTMYFGLADNGKMYINIDLLKIAKDYCEFNADKSCTTSSLLSLIEIMLN